MGRLRVIASLGPSAGMGAPDLPAPPGEHGGDDRPRCAAPAEPRRAAPLAARDRLSYLFGV
jgi:hypothetical protein